MGFRQALPRPNYARSCLSIITEGTTIETNEACTLLSETGFNQVFTIGIAILFISVAVVVLVKRRKTLSVSMAVALLIALIVMPVQSVAALGPACKIPPSNAIAPEPLGPIVPQLTLQSDIYNPVPNVIYDFAPEYFSILANDKLPVNDQFDLTTLDLDLAVPGVQQSITLNDINNDPTQSLTLTVRGSVIALSGEVDSDSQVSLLYTLNTTTGVPAAAPAIIQFVFSDTVTRAVSAADDIDVMAVLEIGDTVEFDLVSNDSATSGDLEVATIDIDPNISGRQTTYAVNSKGQYVLRADGVLVFTATAKLENTDVFGSYTIQDDSENTSNLALFGLRLQPVID